MEDVEGAMPAGDGVSRGESAGFLHGLFERNVAVPPASARMILRKCLQASGCFTVGDQALKFRQAKRIAQFKFVERRKQERPGGFGQARVDVQFESPLAEETLFFPFAALLIAAGLSRARPTVGPTIKISTASGLTRPPLRPPAWSHGLFSPRPCFPAVFRRAGSLYLPKRRSLLP